MCSWSVPLESNSAAIRNFNVCMVCRNMMLFTYVTMLLTNGRRFYSIIVGRSWGCLSSLRAGRSDGFECELSLLYVRKIGQKFFFSFSEKRSALR